MQLPEPGEAPPNAVLDCFAREVFGDATPEAQPAQTISCNGTI